jgi:hypothetical protein
LAVAVIEALLTEGCSGSQVEPLLEVLAGQALERALAEALEERELAALRARQAAYQQARQHPSSMMSLSCCAALTWTELAARDRYIIWGLGGASTHAKVHQRRICSKGHRRS